MEQHFINNLRNFSGRWIDGTNEMWVMQYPFDSWDHPVWGTTTIDQTKADELKRSFDEGVRGQKIFADYEHGLDKAKGSKAAGDIKELKVVAEPRGVFSQPGLWARVSFSDTARSEIDAGEWNYWSTSHYDTWTHPQEGKTYNMVYNGGGLTNTPWVKGMAPLNFSEFAITQDDMEALREFAVLSAADRKSLPDGAYMYIAPDGTRMFPFKHADGSLDKVHLQKIVQLAPRASVPDGVKNRVIARAKRLLGAQNNSETVGILEQLESEPIVGDGGDELTAIDTGEGGDNVPNELEAQLREALGLDADADLIAHVKTMNDELTPMREALKQHSEKKAFAEQYPEEYKRLQALESESRNTSAKSFSESFNDRRFIKLNGESEENTTMGLSALSLDKVREFALEFSEGKPDLGGFREVMETVMGAGGIVDYGTKGSSREKDEDEDDLRTFSEREVDKMTPQEIRKVFAEKVTEVMEKDELTYNAALAQAGTLFPHLAKAYIGHSPVK